MPPPPPEDLFVVLGAPRALWSDTTHAFLRTTWPRALSGIAVGYLLLNALFATAYFLVGGVANLPADSWRQAFYFSVQTMGTIGYGSMYPQSDPAHLLVVAESVVGLVATAVATGLVFTKFGRTRSRVRFSRHAAIGPHEGVPTLQVRIGNERSNRIVDARFELSLIRTERTREGTTFYRTIDLPLLRPRNAALRQAFTLLHPIDRHSPLHGYDLARLNADEVELNVLVTGMDDTTLQPIHASHSYAVEDLRWGARPADMITVIEGDRLQVDLGRFHTLTPSPLVGGEEGGEEETG